MNILHRQFKTIWSWTEIAKGLFKELPDHNFTTEYSNANTNTDGYDVILVQQALILSNIQQKYKAIARIGTNSIFDGRYQVDEIKNNMRQCFAVIATNNFLYKIAKEVNPNTVLIPNGIDLTEWSIIKKQPKEFTVGFVGNISNLEYRDYKGYDFVEQACKELDIPLRTALYGENQILHDEMRARFYSKVSCIVHPTKGEGNSNTLMEAIACGIPCITTREAGFHGEMLEQEKNVLFCERSVESVKQCIEQLRKDKGLYKKIKINGRKFAEQYHDIKKIAKQYDALFQACYRANKERERQQVKGRCKVKVKVIKEFYEDYICMPGDIFETTEERARQLKGYVVPVEQTPPQVVKAVVEPPRDKMVKEPVEKKEIDEFVCDVCGFKAKNKLGLINHQRRHR